MKNDTKQVCICLSPDDFKELNDFLELSGNKNKSFLEIVDRALKKTNYIAENLGPVEKLNFRLPKKTHDELKKKAKALNVSIGRLIIKSLNE